MNEPGSIDILLNRVRNGNREALGELFEQFRSRLKLAVGLHMDGRLGTRVSLSDVVQEVYFDVEQQIDAYLKNPQITLYVWMRSLACQRLIKIQHRHFTAQRRTVKKECPLPMESSIALGRQLLVAAGSSPSQGVMKQELRQRVQQSIDQLKAEDREVILMREFEGMTNSEVAQSLGLSDSAATMRYGRALFRLKEILMKDFGSKESIS